MTLWQARQVSIIISNAIASPNTTADFYSAADAVAGAQGDLFFISTMKNITFTEPEVSTNEVKLLGATGGNQNQELDPQSPTKGELTGTLILNPEPDSMFDLEQFKLSSVTPATSYTKRYNYASAAPSEGVAVVIKLTDGTDIVQVLLNNATIESLGGLKIDADGHAEQEIKVTSAADDCWKEWKGT